MTIQYYLTKATNFVNTIDSRLLISFVITSYYLTFALSGGEEQYFALAKQFWNPDWIPNSFTLTEWPGNRLVYQYVIGFLLSFLSFEQLAFWGKLVNFILLSFPLALIAKRLKINNIETIFLIVVFFAFRQAFMSGEWVVRSMEGKSVAYIFVFYALYYTFKRQYAKVAIGAAIATYFHVLVGGWFSILIGLYLLVFNQNIKTILSYSVVYGVLILPFFIYLITFLAQNESVINGLNLDWVYTYQRVSHHVAPFKDERTFRKLFSGGLVTSVVFFCFHLFYFRKLDNKDMQQIANLCLVGLSMIFVATVIAYFDTNGKILKLYPFRITSVVTFLCFTQLVIYLKHKVIPQHRKSIYYSVLLVGLLPFILSKTVTTTQKLLHTKVNQDFNELVEVVNTQTPKEAVFMVFSEKPNKKTIEDLYPFCRKTRRERFVIFKFVPSGGEKIYEWYTRWLAKKKLEADISYLPEFNKQYQVDYLISKKPYPNTAGLDSVFANETYYLYKIR